MQNLLILLNLIVCVFAVYAFEEDDEPHLIDTFNYGKPKRSEVVQRFERDLIADETAGGGGSGGDGAVNYKVVKVI